MSVTYKDDYSVLRTVWSSFLLAAPYIDKQISILSIYISNQGE